MSTPEDVAARPDWADEKARAIAESISAHTDQSDSVRVRTLTDGIAYSVATALREAEQRGTADQEEAGRLANISTARAVERAEKAEAVVERLERERDGYASNFRDAWAAINRLREEVETRSGGMVAPEHTGPEFGHEAEQIARGVIAIYDRAIAAEAWKRVALALLPKEPAFSPQDGLCCFRRTRLGNGKERWVGEGCHCQNYDDAQRAASWADDMNRWLDAQDLLAQEGLSAPATREEPNG